MREFKVFKNGDFTVMSNYHLKDKNLSLKAAGLMSKMLSLPDDWDYSLAGLVAICKESTDTIRSTLNELKCHNYIEIQKLRTEKGTFRYNYLIFENPFEKDLKMGIKPDRENPYLDEPNEENYNQSNIKESNINNKNDNIDNIDKSQKGIALKHKTLINELIRTGYIKEDDEQILLYDSLFDKYVNNGNSYTDIYSAIHYIVPRVMSRSFIDEEGKDISNKFGYLKTSIESNFRKLNSYNEELYPDDDNSSFWDDYKFIDREGR